MGAAQDSLLPPARQIGAGRPQSLVALFRKFEVRTEGTARTLLAAIDAELAGHRGGAPASGDQVFTNVADYVGNPERHPSVARLRGYLERREPRRGVDSSIGARGRDGVIVHPNGDQEMTPDRIAAERAARALRRGAPR